MHGTTGGDSSDHDVLTRAYRKGEVTAENFPLDEVSDHLTDPDTVVWVDLCGPSTAQLSSLAEELGLHELAVEDALGRHQRPKIDYYATHLFLACHAVRVDPDAGELKVTEIDAFIDTRTRPRRGRGQLPPLGSSMRWSTATSTSCRRSTTSTTRSATASSPSIRSNRRNSVTGSRCASR